MIKTISILSFILLPFLLTAQSVTITPGAQSINGDSTSQDQLNVFGNGLLVSPKVRFTDEDPADNVHNMDCTTAILSESLAGTLKDPNGDSDYLGGVPYDCYFRFNTFDSRFLAYQIDFEVLDTEANSDTVFIMFFTTILASYSGNTIPSSIRVPYPYVTVKFKTGSSGAGGAGFELTWRAILSDGTPSTIQNYTGQGMVYDVASNSLWSGEHAPINFQNKGIYSTALGLNNSASGSYSTAMGERTSASGESSTAMGERTTASGLSSTALGERTAASGPYSTAMGFRTTASGWHSTAMGLSTEASGSYSTAMGRSTEASGIAATAMGRSTLADTTYATAMGKSTKARGYSSTAMGERTEADTAYATAMGKSTKASGYSSTAMGEETVAEGSYSTAMGFESWALGESSIAMGKNAVSLGNYSVAMGRNTIASDSSATAMGGFTNAFGKYSTAMGKLTEASGDYSTAMGENTTAIGDNSTAIGKDVTANGNGTLIIGDSNPGGTAYVSGSTDKFIGRFYNGYYFLTSESGTLARGVQITHDQTAWSSISDSTQKENFLPADGEAFLKKLKDLRLGSWNYKTQETNPERFYGPMAQEIFAAYGKDAIGTIGSDTLVSTLNMDGLLFIFAKELEKRTSDLQNETDHLKKENEDLKKSNDDLQQRFLALEKSIKAEIMELRTITAIGIK